MPTTTSTTQPIKHFDVCIVGGGPQALATLSALHEPYAVVTGGNQYDNALNRRRSSGGSRRRGSGGNSPKPNGMGVSMDESSSADEADKPGLSVCVIDPQPWMEAWNQRFERLGIQYLRSPASAHPDAFAMESLVTFAREMDREDELYEIEGYAQSNSFTVSQSTCPSQWALPSTSLFKDFCQHLVTKYPHDYRLGWVADITKVDGAMADQSEDALTAESVAEQSPTKGRRAKKKAKKGGKQRRRQRESFDSDSDSATSHRAMLAGMGNDASIGDEQSQGRFIVTYNPRDGATGAPSAPSTCTLSCDHVVLATGAAGVANIPEDFQAWLGEESSFKHQIAHVGSAGCDEIFNALSRRSSFQQQQQQEELREKTDQPSHTLSPVPSMTTSHTPRPRVLVVGGGLSAAQAALRAASIVGPGRDEKGDPSSCGVVLCSRRPLQTRQFDIPLEWFDIKSHRRLRFKFYNVDKSERKQWMAKTRSGGTIPKEYLTAVRKASPSIESRVSAHVEPLGMNTYEADDRHGGAVRRRLSVSFDDGVVEEFDYVILATGTIVDCTSIPLYSKLVKQMSLPVVTGLPDIGTSLEWAPGLYTTGNLAALQLGPYASNLMGARLAGEVIADSLGVHNVLEEEYGVRTNMFEQLTCDDCCC